MVLSPSIENPIRVFANVLTNIGRQIITGRLLGGLTGNTPGANTPSHIAWGTGAGTAAVGDTTLFTEAAEARVAGTVTQSTTGVTNDTLQVQGTLTAIAAKTITNAGLFDVTKAEAGVVGGNLFVKSDFAGIALNTGDSINFTFRWQIQ